MDYIPSFTLLVLETMALHVETGKVGVTVEYGI